jgi:hypothetical protein
MTSDIADALAVNLLRINGDQLAVRSLDEPRFASSMKCARVGHLNAALCTFVNVSRSVAVLKGVNCWIALTVGLSNAELTRRLGFVVGDFVRLASRRQLGVVSSLYVSTRGRSILLLPQPVMSVRPSAFQHAFPWQLTAGLIATYGWYIKPRLDRPRQNCVMYSVG